MNSINKKKLIGQPNICRSVLILLIIRAFAAILSLNFLSVASLSSVFKQIIVAGIVGCGMILVIFTGGIDLPVGSIPGLASVLTSGILESTGNTGAAILMALAVGIGCGAVNGFFVAVCEILPFISILGMTTLLRGCILVYIKGSPIPIKMNAYKLFSKGTVAGVPVPVIILIILFLIAHYMLIQTSYGRSIYALRGNREVARLPGTSVRFAEWMVYTLNSLMCGVADVILMARLGSAQSTNDTGIEMDAIAAIILGGTSLSDSMGFVLPIMVSAMIMGIIDNILTPMNIDPHATNIVKGAIILIVVLMDKRVKDLSVKAE